MSKHLVFPQPDETRKQKCSTAFQTTPRPVAKRRPLAHCYPASGAGGHRAGSWTPPMRGSAMPLPHSGGAADNTILQYARRREQKTYTVIIRWYARTHPTLHSHHPHVKLEISFKASHARNATPTRNCHRSAPCPRLACAPHVASTTSARGRARRASRPAVHRTSQAASAPLRKRGGALQTLGLRQRRPR